MSRARQPAPTSRSSCSRLRLFVPLNAMCSRKWAVLAWGGRLRSSVVNILCLRSHPLFSAVSKRLPASMCTATVAVWCGDCRGEGGQGQCPVATALCLLRTFSVTTRKPLASVVICVSGRPLLLGAAAGAGAAAAALARRRLPRTGRSTRCISAVG